ncbi:Fis family transcriptional regulator [Thioalkalivibrio sp. ALE21]|uniref:helix-turn-helix domain-containing protein n=1 Tax=Thioalkalivibrio sp. ALE21 TaxID=1158175 RepID=UPI000D983186|nr:helix-turn-helix domain-containing protein [Thioalkalivibrio sp. ALE21]PYG03233.1 Fis family transcriptional regulator [Thioalkalivibrio sp. ALE21]
MSTNGYSARRKEGNGQAWPGSDPAGEVESESVLAQSVRQAMEEYFDTLDGQSSHDLYALVMEEVERPLLASVLERCGYNQSRTAAVLGLNRATLRKKLRSHGLLES